MSAGAAPSRKPVALVLAAVAAALLLVSSLSAILLEDGGRPAPFVTVRGEESLLHGGGGVYRFDTPFKAAIFLGVNGADLLITLPLLTVGSIAYARGRKAGGVLLATVFGYLAYFYMIGSMGNAFNGLFLVWTLLVSVGLAGATVILADVDGGRIRDALGQKFPRKAVAAYLVLFAGMLAAQYLAQILGAYADGKPPAELGPYTTLELASLELGIMIPLHLYGAWLLWTARPAGYPLAAVLTGMAALAFLSLTAGQSLYFFGFHGGSWTDPVLMAVLASVSSAFFLRIFLPLRTSDTTVPGG